MRDLTAFTLQQELLQEDPIQGVLSQLIIPLAPIQDPGQGEAGEGKRKAILGTERGNPYPSCTRLGSE